MAENNKYLLPHSFCGLPWWLSGKESTCNAGDTGDAMLWSRADNSDGDTELCGLGSDAIVFYCLSGEVECVLGLS